eukprot:jgi/Psemu1/42957/gm1.42957_g
MSKEQRQELYQMQLQNKKKRALKAAETKKEKEAEKSGAGDSFGSKSKKNMVSWLLYKMNVPGAIDDGEDEEGYCKLDSHADTTAAGSNMILLNPDQVTTHVDRIPIGTCATTWTDPPSGNVDIIIFHQALVFGNKWKNSLIFPNQVRDCNFNSVEEAPQQFDPRSKHAITIQTVKEDDDPKKPTKTELEECDYLPAANDVPWDPHSLKFRIAELTIDSGDPVSLQAVVTNVSTAATELASNVPSKLDKAEKAVKHPDLQEHSKLLRLHQVSTMRMLTECVIATDGKIAHRISSVPSIFQEINISSLQTKEDQFLYDDSEFEFHELSTIEDPNKMNSERLSKTWNVSLKKAEQTLKRFRNKRVAPAGTWYTDTWFAKTPSVMRQDKCAQIFTNGTGYEEFIPIQGKSYAHQGLKIIISEVGIPEHIVSDGAPEQRSPRTYKTQWNSIAFCGELAGAGEKLYPELKPFSEREIWQIFGLYVLHGNDFVHQAFTRGESTNPYKWHKHFKAFLACQDPCIPTPSRKDIAVDEMTMRFKGQHIDKHQITYKREGDGFQADALLYMRNDPAPKKYLDMGRSPLHSRTMWLFESLKDEHHHVGIDNLYNSVMFCKAAFRHSKRVLCHGVARKENCGIPDCVFQQELKNIQAQQVAQGAVKAAVVEGDPERAFLIASSVYDTKPVHYLNTYNNGMGDVDIGDQLREVYRLDRCVWNWKWWWPVMFWAIGVLLMNAYKLYLSVCKEEGITKPKYDAQYNFRRAIGEYWVDPDLFANEHRRRLLQYVSINNPVKHGWEQCLTSGTRKRWNGMLANREIEHTKEGFRGTVWAYINVITLDPDAKGTMTAAFENQHMVKPLEVLAEHDHFSRVGTILDYIDMLPGDDDNNLTEQHRKGMFFKTHPRSWRRRTNKDADLDKEEEDLEEEIADKEMAEENAGNIHKGTTRGISVISTQRSRQHDLIHNISDPATAPTQEASTRMAYWGDNSMEAEANLEAEVMEQEEDPMRATTTRHGDRTIMETASPT